MNHLLVGGKRVKTLSMYWVRAACVAGAICAGCGPDATPRVPAVLAAPESGARERGAGPAPKPSTEPPWNQCRWHERGTATPEALGEAVWANVVKDAPREAYAALVPGRCEYFALLFEGSDARHADEVFRQVRDFEAEFPAARLAQRTIVAGKSLATKPNRVTAESCSGVEDQGCQRVRMVGSEPEALTFEVLTARIDGRYYLTSAAALRAAPSADVVSEPPGETGDGSPPASQDPVPGIVMTAPYTYTINRAAFTKALPISKIDVQQSARTIPYYVGGAYSGFKLVGVRPGSLLRALGVRSGDAFVSINGKPIDGPAKALVVDDALKSAKGRVVFEIVRRGSPITLTWDFK